MPYLCGEIVDRVRRTLNDVIVPPLIDGQQWKNAELLQHLNNGIAAIVDTDNKASIINASFQMQPGTKQLLAGDAVALIGVVRNMGTDGATAGRAITSVTDDDMNASRPNWHSDPPGSVIRHYVSDPSDPRRYYVWPPADGSGYVELQYEQVPDDVSILYTATSDVVAAGSITVPVASTFGLKAGQGIQCLSNPQAILPPSGPYFTTLTSILSVGVGTVTLTAAVLQTLPLGTVLVFSDRFPLPDMYSEAAYLFVTGHAYAKNTARGDLQKSAQFLDLFNKALGADQEAVDRLKIGRPAQ